MDRFLFNSTLFVTLLLSGCVSSKSNSSIIISKSIQDGININQKLSDGSYLLIQAVKQKKADIVKVLLENGANPNVKDNNDYSALMYAVGEKCNQKIVELLLEHGADINMASSDTNFGLTALNMTSEPKIIELLLSHRPNIIIKSKDGIRILDTSSNTQIVKYFLDNNGDIKDIENPETTELMRAAILNDMTIAKRILSIEKNIKKINQKDNKGWTALMFACKYGHKEMAELLISNGANINTSNNRLCTSLMIATYERQYEIVKLLLENDADVKAKDKSGKDALYYSWTRKFDNNTRKTLDILLKYGADIDSADMTGESSLMNSVINNSSINDIEFLCAKGANIDFQNYLKNTALIKAVIDNNYEITSCLLKNKAAVNLLNIENLTALDYALRHLGDYVPVYGRKPIITNLIYLLLRKHGAKTAAELKAEKKAEKTKNSDKPKPAPAPEPKE